MNSLIKMLKETRQELCRNKNNIPRANNIPEGHIRINSSGNRTRFYLVNKETKQMSSGGRILKKNEFEVAKQIIQKDYDAKIAKEVDRQIELIDYILGQYSGTEFEDIYDKLHNKRKAIIKPSDLDSRAFSDAWQTQEYEGKSIGPDTPEIYTEKGERVRSKSEKIIADKLFVRGIPYQYEYPIQLGSWGTVYPDFRVLNVRERKTMYWEHLGMMGQPDYVENAVVKINQYERNGIMLGEQLILTLETQQRPIDTKIVDLLISKYLL